MKRVKQFILNNKLLYNFVIPIHKFVYDIRLYNTYRKVLPKKTDNKSYIYYLGIPLHTNLGDLAQGVCIRRWLKKHYPQMRVIEIETNVLVNTSFSLLQELKKAYKKNDIIVFQSGYTTTDLGGYADEMHRAIIEALPNAKMLMLPQTIYFKNESNKERTSKVYNRARNMLFLARDRISYGIALEMFPDISVKLFPDIVTSMIGQYRFKSERNGVLFCCRNDGEKFYSAEEIDALVKRCRTLCNVVKTDTTKSGDSKLIISDSENYVKDEIENYSHYRIVVTDRYHGTIFSLVANTPVIIIKTTDHKVTTGAEWFKGIYDDYVYLANSTDEAFEIVQALLKKKMNYKLNPYFEHNYYNKLPALFDN